MDLSCSGCVDVGTTLGKEAIMINPACSAGRKGPGMADQGTWRWGRGDPHKVSQKKKKKIKNPITFF